MPRELGPWRKLPANLSPTGTRCIMVDIPDDDEWERAMWDDLKRLQLWNFWARDAGHNGKPVADRWVRALASWRHCDGSPNPINDEFEEDMNLCDIIRYHDGKLQIMCCGEWEDVPGTGDGEAPAGHQPGPAPAPDPGGSACYPVLLDGKAVWRLPFPVSDGDVVTISAVSGSWWDGAVGPWYCPDGGSFVFGGCFGSGGFSGGDPASAVHHMRPVYKVNGVWFDGYNTTTTLSGVGTNQFLDFQANDSDLSDNQGSITFKVCVTNGATPPPAEWCYVMDFTVADYGWLQGPSYGAAWTAGVGWVTIAVGIFINLTLPSSVDLTGIDVYFDTDGTDQGGSCSPQQFGVEDRTIGGGSVQWFDDCVNAYSGQSPITDTSDFSIVAGHQLEIGANNVSSSTWTISKVILRGTGANPFGVSNC